MSKILCVDDDAFIRKMLQFNFKKAGIDCEVCENGYEALEMLSSGHYDLALIDIMMPQMDGFTLLEEIKKHDRNLPVIFLTAKKSDQAVTQGLSLGAEDFITKPFKINELNLKVNKILDQH